MSKVKDLQIEELQKIEESAKEDRELKKNKSGMPDPTAYHAIKKVDSYLDRDFEAEKYGKLIRTILNICTLAGFTVEERIVLRSNKTGRIWR